MRSAENCLGCQALHNPENLSPLGLCSECRPKPLDPLIRTGPLKDSGKRVRSPTGAVRDSAAGRGRYDLISPVMMERLAIHLEKGAEKYEERNWEKGLPIGRMFASLFRHSWQAFQGYTDEDHLAAVLCNAMSILHTLEMIKRGALPANLDDRPHYGLVPVGEPDIRYPKDGCHKCGAKWPECGHD